MRKFTDEFRLILLIASIALCKMTYAFELQFESGTNQTTLIELYTSQGCSSCPPAEEYLNKFKSNADLWKKYIPMALHVNYWDYIGWKDRFSQPDHTTRQQQYARLQGMSTIYTPGFFVNGVEWRRGFFTSSLPSARNNVGVLGVTIIGENVQVKFSPENRLNSALQFNIALLGMGLATEIKAGERKGRHTRHEFVVLAKNSSTQIQPHNNIYQWQTALPQNNKIQAKNYAVVVWVNKADNLTPLQAAADFLQ